MARSTLIAFLAALAALCAVSTAAAQSAVQPEPVPVAISGRRIHAVCSGAGAPGIVLMHGDRSSVAAWSEVMGPLARLSRVCAYDRPGHGQSDSAAGPLSPTELVLETRSVLQQLGMDRAVVVAHSLAGLYARLLTVQSPETVAGLVLVDPTHEDMREEVRGAVPDAYWEQWGEERLRNADGVNELEVADILRAAGAPAVPVRVITATERTTAPGYDAACLDRTARELHVAIARGAADGRQIVAENSGHNVQRDDPELVIETVREVLGRVRR